MGHSIRKNARVSAPVAPPSIPPPPTPLPAGTGTEREVMFRARVARWWPDLLGGLTAANGADRAADLGADLLDHGAGHTK